jgi:FtsZ-binding cell division protein ZapB
MHPRSIMAVLFVLASSLAFGAADAITVDAESKVGIGIATPSAKLHVHGSGVGGTLILSDPDHAPLLQMYNQSANSGFLFKNTGSSGESKMEFIKDSTVAIVVNNVCDIGVGTTSPLYKLHIVGKGTTDSTYSLVVNQSNDQVNNFWIRDDGQGWLRAAAWVYGSDRQLKKNIQYFNDGLDKVLALKPAFFDYINGTNNEVGFIAQDVQTVIPKSVVATDAKGTLGLKTEHIIPYLVNSVKSLKSELDGLKRENDALKAQNQKLSDTVDALVKRIEALEAAQKPTQPAQEQ